MATHSNILAWEIPWTEDWWAAVLGITKRLNTIVSKCPDPPTVFKKGVAWPSGAGWLPSTEGSAPCPPAALPPPRPLSTKGPGSSNWGGPLSPKQAPLVGRTVRRHPVSGRRGQSLGPVFPGVCVLTLGGGRQSSSGSAWGSLMLRVDQEKTRHGPSRESALGPGCHRSLCPLGVGQA